MIDIYSTKMNIESIKSTWGFVDDVLLELEDSISDIKIEGSYSEAFGLNRSFVSINFLEPCVDKPRYTTAIYFKNSDLDNPIIGGHGNYSSGDQVKFIMKREIDSSSYGIYVYLGNKNRVSDIYLK